MQLFLFLPVLILIFFYAPTVSASHTFTVTSFDGQKDFLWEGGPTSGCSAINSYVMTVPGNDQQSKLFVCEQTFGASVDVIPDGQYYLFLAVGGHGWRSQVFTITNGVLSDTLPTATPTPTPVALNTPTPTIINHPPTAVAGTSLDENGNLQLDGSLSSDSENDTLTYTWFLPGRGNIKAGQKVSLHDIPSGTYNITLEVKDSTNQTRDTIKVGIVSKKTPATLGMKIKSVLIDKKDGDFTMKGELDAKNPLFKNIVTSPISRVLFELQTGGTSITPIYGAAGESVITLKTKSHSFKLHDFDED